MGKTKIFLIFLFMFIFFVFGFKGKNKTFDGNFKKSFKIKQVSIDIIDDRKIKGFSSKILLENYFLERLNFWLGQKGTIFYDIEGSDVINISLYIKYRRDIKDKLIFGQILEYNLKLTNMKKNNKNPKNFILRFDLNEDFFSSEEYKGNFVEYNKFNFLGIERARRNFYLQTNFNKKFNILEKKESYNYLFLSKKLKRELSKVYLLGEIGYDDMFERIDFDDIIKLTASEIIRLAR